jgi:hypothetical protein
LLNARPLVNAENTRKIEAGVANGKLLNRARFDPLLEEAKS